MISEGVDWTTVQVVNLLHQGELVTLELEDVETVLVTSEEGWLLSEVDEFQDGDRSAHLIEGLTEQEWEFSLFVDSVNRDKWLNIHFSNRTGITTESDNVSLLVGAGSSDNNSVLLD